MSVVLLLMPHCWRNLLLILSIEILSSQLTSTTNDTCGELPCRCQFVDYSRYVIDNLLGQIKQDIRCESGSSFDQACLSVLETTWRGCSRLRKGVEVEITFKSSSKRLEILDDSFAGLFKLGTTANNNNNNISDTFANLLWFNFYNIKGFEIGSIFNVHNKTLRFFNHFNLYKSNRLIRDCRDFQADREVNNESKSFIFSSPYPDEQNSDELGPKCRSSSTFGCQVGQLTFYHRSFNKK